MSQLEKRPKVKLDARVSPELKEKVREHQQAQGMKEISEAITDLIERGLLPHSQINGLPRCDFKSEIPKLLGKYINCKKGSYPRAFTVTMTIQDCDECNRERCRKLSELEQVEQLRKREMERISAMDQREREQAFETLRPQSNPQTIKRIIEQNTTKKTTEFVTSPEPKKISEPILCPRLSPPDFVSVDDACKKCGQCATCRNYEEYFILKRAMPNR
jgi:hypothetical protein